LYRGKLVDVYRLVAAESEPSRDAGPDANSATVVGGDATFTDREDYVDPSTGEVVGGREREADEAAREVPKAKREGCGGGR
jgi:hypothetical protein